MEPTIPTEMQVSNNWLRMHGIPAKRKKIKVKRLKDKEPPKMFLEEKPIPSETNSQKISYEQKVKTVCQNSLAHMPSYR